MIVFEKIVKYYRGVKRLLSFGIKMHFLGMKGPGAAFLVLTSRCNLKCKYCSWWKRDTKELKTSEIIKIVDELADLGTYFITLTGGEVLIREDLPEIIKHIRKYGISVGVSTNGTLLKENINKVKGANFIFVSVDGPEEINDMIRGPGTYKKSIGGIKEANKRNMNVHIGTTISRYNVDHLGWVVNKCEELNIGVAFQPLEEWCFSSNIDNMLPEKIEYQKSIDLLIKMKKDGKPVLSSSPYLKLIREMNKKKSKNICFGGRGHCLIDSTGKMYSCCLMHNKNPLDVRKEGVKKSFSKLTNINCKGCVTNGNMELNLACSGNIKSLYNFLVRNIIRYYKF